MVVLLPFCASTGASGCPAARLPFPLREQRHVVRSEVIEVAPTRSGSFGRRRCYIVFPTVAEAVAVANQDGLTVMGELVERGMPGVVPLSAAQFCQSVAVVSVFF